MKKMTLNLIGFYTIVRREIVRFMRIWSQTLLPSVVSSVLYFVIFGELMGHRIGQVAGFSYMEYIVPGLIMMSMVNASYGNVVSSFFLAKFQRNIEEMLVSSLSDHSILLGFIVGGMVRGLLVGFLVFLASVFFVRLNLQNPFIFCLSGILTVLLFSLVGFLNAVFAKKFDDINIVPAFILTPLIYLGGVFYSVELLPDFWKSITRLNPLFYIMGAFRCGMLGCADIDVRATLWMLAFFSIAFYAFNLWLIRKGIGIKS